MHSSIIPCGNVQIALAWQPSSRTSWPYTESYTRVFLFALLSSPQLYIIIRNHSRRHCTQGIDIKMVIFCSVSFHSCRFLHQLLVRKSFSCLSEGYNPLPFPRGRMMLAESRTHSAVLPSTGPTAEVLPDGRMPIIIWATLPHHKKRKMKHWGFSGGCPVRPRESNRKDHTQQHLLVCNWNKMDGQRSQIKAG